MKVVEQNPYDPPVIGDCTEPLAVASAASYGSRQASRFIAANLDHAFAIVLFFAAAMSLAGEEAFQVLPGVAALSSYLGYYFFSELFFGATIGKLAFKLRVRQLSGKRCTARQVAIRTAMRLVEVNPVLLGALPAGIFILCTERRQRLGDLLAGTVVVGI